MKLKTLSILTSVLFIISILVFVNENKRGTDLLAGSDYIKGLDINKVQKIVLSYKDSKKIILTKDSNRFVLENYKSYPTDTLKVNDLIYKIASIQVKEKITSNANEDDLKKFELDEKSRKYLIELFDNNGRKTVSFSVGKSQKGKGNYLLKDGTNEVYFSNSNLLINSSYKHFVNTVLLDINKSDIEQIKLISDKEIEFIKKDTKFVIERPKNNKFKEEKAEEYAKNFSSLKFNDFFTHADNEVQSLAFDKDIKIQLKNKLVYKVGLAKNKDKYFVKLNALVDEIPRQITVSKDDGREKLQSIDDMVKAQGDAHRINIEKGNWIYKVDKSVYDKIAKDSKFFM